MRHTMNTADGQEFMDLSIHLSTYFAICNNELSSAQNSIAECVSTFGMFGG